MQVRAVDPRSTKWELDNPVFYVSFFRHDSTRIHVPSESVSYESEEWELTGGDVQDALAWAKIMPARTGAGPFMLLASHRKGPV